MDGQAWFAVAVGVAENPDAVAPVIVSEGTSRNIENPHFVIANFQVSHHLLEFGVDDSRHIFSNNPSGPGFFHDSKHFRPEVMSRCAASTGA